MDRSLKKGSLLEGFLKGSIRVSIGFLYGYCWSVIQG